jgi:hypothetical protein
MPQPVVAQSPRIRFAFPRRWARRALKLTRRREREPSTARVVALLVADLLFVCAILAVLSSPPPAGWKPAPQSAAAAYGLQARPQAVQTFIGPQASSARPRARRRRGLS